MQWRAAVTEVTAMARKLLPLLVVIPLLALLPPSARPASGEAAMAVTAGGMHTCALTTGGGVKGRGANAFGRLGDGPTTHRTTPIAEAGLSGGVTAVNAGDWHPCALTTG